MAEIKETLRLEDGFSPVLDSFLSRLEKLEKAQNILLDNFKDTNDRTDEFNNKIEKLDRSVGKLADGGLDRLWRKLLAIGTAYFGLRALQRTAFQGLNSLDEEYRLSNQFATSIEDGGAIRDKARAKGNEYGISTNEALSVNSSISKITTDLNKFDGFWKLGEKLASINPNVSVSQATNQLASGIKGRNVNGILDSMGIVANSTQRANMNRQLQFGEYEAVIKQINELAEASGATQEAVDRMLSSPLQKLNRISATFQNTFARAGEFIIEGLTPAIDFLSEFIQTKEFEAFMDTIARGFYLLGRAIGTIGTYLLQNRDAIMDMLKKLTIGLTIFVGIMGALKLATIAATVAQWKFNMAAWANPVGLITLAVIGLTAALVALATYLTKFVDEGSSTFERFIGVLAALGAGIYNIFVYVINNIIEGINNLLRLFGMFGNFFFNVFKLPIESIKVLMASLFDFITEKINGLLGGLGGAVGKLGELLNIDWAKNAGQSLSGLGDKIGNFGQQNKENTLAAAKEKGYTELFNTEDILNKLGYKDITSAYSSGTEFAKNLTEMTDKITTSFRQFSGKQDKTNDLLYNTNMLLDKDSWMDQFSEFAVGDAEMRKMMNVNSENKINPNYNINIDAAGMSKEELEKMLKKVMAENNSELYKNYGRLYYR